MELSPILTFQDLYAFSQAYRSGRWVFRGLSDASYDLKPKVGRAGIETRNERRILEFFLREASSYETNLPSSEWELLAIAQHHGLPTRLLDWTENPLVGAYFACCAHLDRDGALYVIQVRDEVSNLSSSPFSIDTLVRYRPRCVTRRISAQRGLFTVHPDPETGVAMGDGGNVILRRAVIPVQAKHKLLWNLSRFDVNERSLFPDLVGLAGHIQWMFSDNDPSEEEFAVDTFRGSKRLRETVRR